MIRRKIFTFRGPNGEVVKWGEFGDNRPITFEMEVYSDNGALQETEKVEIVLPDGLKQFFGVEERQVLTD